MIVWTEKAEHDYAERHGSRYNPRKAGTLAKWGEVVVADDYELMKAFLIRGWVKNDREKESTERYGVTMQRKRIRTLRENTEKRAEVRWLQIQHYIDLGLTTREIGERLDVVPRQVRRWTRKWRPILKDKFGDIQFKKGRK